MNETTSSVKVAEVVSGEREESRGPCRRPVKKGTARTAPEPVVFSLSAKGVVVLAFAAFLIPSLTFAQSRKSKVPVLNKLGGTEHLAFSGIVTSLDMKLKALSVRRTESKDIEIFPLRKTTHIQNAGGKALNLKALAPGTNVLIYYNEKAGERKITQVVVLGSKNSPKNKATHSAS